MPRNQETIAVSGVAITIMVLLNGILLKEAYTSDRQLYWGLIITVPLLLWAIASSNKK